MARSLRSKRKPAIEDTVEAPAEVDWLAAGDENVNKAVSRANSLRRPKLMEFYFTKDEVKAKADPTTGKKKAVGTASALVHFACNYADQEYKTVIPRISVKQNGRYNNYTSPYEDCAIKLATGQSPSMRPVFVLCDHREFEYDGKDYVDMIKVWIPAGAILGLVDTAIDNLCEAVDIDREDIDITQYPVRITKSGSGRKIAWTISFIPKVSEINDEAYERILTFFHGKDKMEEDDTITEVTPDDHKSKMRKLLAPDPAYMISKGGVFRTAPKATQEESEEDLPF